MKTFKSKEDAVKFYGQAVQDALFKVEHRHISWGEKFYKVHSSLSKMEGYTNVIGSDSADKKSGLHVSGTLTMKDSYERVTFYGWSPIKKGEACFVQFATGFEFCYKIEHKVQTNSGPLESKPVQHAVKAFDSGYQEYVMRKIHSLHNRFEHKRI